jgi:hypothetical protein
MNTADQSGNMRKELKRTIFETVSTLRNIFNKMKGMIDEKTRQNKQMEKEINTVKTELDSCRSVTATRHAEISKFREREPPRTISRQVLTSQHSNRKLYSRVVAGCAERKHRLTLRSKVNQLPRRDQKVIEDESEPYRN